MSSGESKPPDPSATSALDRLIEAPRDPVDAGEQLARELAELEKTAREGGPPRAWLWYGQPAIVASLADAQAPRFGVAAAASARAGWPVHVRASGGTAVALTAGILNLALIQPWFRHRPRLEAGFDLICGLLIGALADIGVAAATGRVPDAFCDGRFNVLVGTRKFAGTSQRQSNRGERGASLVHATMLIDADLRAITDAVNYFYERADVARSHRAEAIINLVDCASAPPGRDFRSILVNKLKEPLRFGGGEAQGVPETNAVSQHPWV